MRVLSPFSQLRRAIGLGLATLGIMVGAGPATGCLYPDYCIKIGIAGSHTCLLFTNAGILDEEGQIVEALTDGLEPPTGCDCLRQSEVEILESGDVDSPEYQLIYFGLETKAREDCLALAIEQELSNTNCLTAEIEGFITENQQVECTAGCVYSNPPPNGRCPECTLDDNASGETGGQDESGEEDTGSDPPSLPRLNVGGGS